MKNNESGATLPPPMALRRARVMPEVYGQALIHRSRDLRIADATEKGVPWRWSQEAHLPALCPDGTDLSCQPGIVGSALQESDNLLLFPQALGSERTTERDDNHVLPLLTNVSDIK